IVVKMFQRFPGACGTPPPENGLGPTGEEAADEDELADVVGVVVGEQESLAEERLVIGVSDGREEIGGSVFDFGGEFFQVSAKGADAFVPGFWIGRRGSTLAIAGGKF